MQAHAYQPLPPKSEFESVGVLSKRPPARLDDTAKAQITQMSRSTARGLVKDGCPLVPEKRDDADKSREECTITLTPRSPVQDAPEASASQKLNMLFQHFYFRPGTVHAWQASHELECFGFRCACLPPAGFGAWS